MGKDTECLYGERVQIAERIAEIWNHEAINYAVAHGLKGYPYKIGRDLDVLMESRDADRALQIAKKTFRTCDWCVIEPPATWGKRLVAFSPGWAESLEIHTFNCLSWATVSLASCPLPSDKTGSFKVDPWVSFIKRVLMPLLGEGAKLCRFHKKPDELKLSEREWVVFARMEGYLGRKLASALKNCLELKDLNNLMRLVPDIRWRLILFSLWRNPVRALRNTVRFLWRRFSAPFQQCGVIIAIVGPDGVGKSTVIKHLKEIIPDVFTQTEVKHWRPGLFPKLGVLIGQSKNHQKGKSVPPRRKPGRFHWLRLSYYALDFFFGYWLKDAVSVSRQRVILYDRCALDMCVDPVRYGLSSASGTRLLWHFIPKPDLVVFLYDSSDRIVVRKPELPKDEIERQLQEWVHLVEIGKVDAIIKVDASPEVIARRLRLLILEAFIQKNGGNLAVQQGSEETIKWIGSILTNSGEEARFYLNSEKKENGKESRDRQVNTFHKITEFAVVPGRSGPQLLIPLTTWSAMASSLNLYNAQKLSARLAKGLLFFGLRVGIAQLFFRSRLRMMAYSDLPSERFKDVFLENYLRELFGSREVVFAFSLGTPGVHQKPVVQVMSANGQVAGYVKVGWNEETIRLVQNEKKVLRKLNESVFSGAIVPHLMHTSSWNGLYLVAQSAPEKIPKNFPSYLTPLHFQFLQGLYALSITTLFLKGSNFWQRLHKRVETLGDSFSYYLHLLCWGMEKAQECFGGGSIPFGWRHGDFTPWNTKMTGKRLFVFDWEYAEKESSPGWDAFHFIIQTAGLVRGWNVERILKTVEGPLIHRFFLDIGLESKWIKPSLLLYLLDILSWHLLLHKDKIGPKEQRMRKLWGQLLSVVSIKVNE